MKNIIKYLGVALLSISVSSCSDFLTYEPSDSVGTETAITTTAGVTNALNGVYNTLGYYPFMGDYVIAIGDIAADNMYMKGTSGHFDAIYQWNFNETTSDLKDIWEYGYKVIDQSTRLINGANKLLLTVESDEDKATIKNALSQAYALKALAEFELVNIFALPYSDANLGTPGLVLVKDESIEPFASVSRATVGETYTQILSDITAAKSNASSSSFDAFMMNPAAISALEARVNLYMKNYSEARDAATSALTLSKGELVMDPVAYSAMWGDIALTSEDIFTIAKSADDNLSANSLNTLYDSYDGKATSGLISLFGENDMRLSLFGDGSGENRRALKYQGLPSSKATSNIPVFRVPEMYLILAEAKAQLGDPTAVDDLFMVASRNPDLKKADIPTDKAGLLNFISVERRRELFQEGHRYFDLRRTGEMMTRVGGIFPVENFDASKFCYPIPADEVNASNLEQNDWKSNIPK